MVFDNGDNYIARQAHIDKPSTSVQLFIKVLLHIRKILNNRRTTRLSHLDLLSIKSQYWSNLLSSSDKARLENIFLKFSKPPKY